MSGYVNFSEGELAGAAGDDPWKLNAELQAGDAGAINELADAFHQSGMYVKEADDEFQSAKRQFNEAYKVNGTEHPIVSSREVAQASAALKGHPEELSSIATDLEQVAAALAVGQRDSEAELAALESYLHEVDDGITANPDQRDQLLQQAVNATKSAAGHLEEIRGAYIAQLDGAEAAMMKSGYAPYVLDSADGVAGNAPREVAQRYDKSGQRARDQSIVDAARAAGRDHYLASMEGRPGFMTREESDAAQRLQDYLAITDPANSPARHAHTQGDERPGRLASQRLDDFMVANSTGPVPKDPVLGGDARTRAQARLQLQHNLEIGNLSWHQQPMLPDEATQLIDQIEVNDRANALVRLQQGLQEAGMTPAGAASATDQMSHGIVPKELVDGASAAGKPVAGAEIALDRAGEAVTKGFLQPEAFSAEDVAALKRIGGHLGYVGTVIDAGVGLYEWQHGTPAGQVVMKTGGGMAGAWALGSFGAEIGSVGGPVGAFAGALIFGTAGAVGGEAAGEQAYKWLTGS